MKKNENGTCEESMFGFDLFQNRKSLKSIIWFGILGRRTHPHNRLEDSFIGGILFPKKKMKKK